MYKIIVFLFPHISNLFAFDGSTILKELGEKEYNSITAKFSLSEYGTCWQDTANSMKSSCNNLSDQEHSLLALKMTHCFLQDSGHVTYNCHLIDLENERRACINGMSDRAFNVYNEFYIHTTHMCFYLSYEAWQKDTDNTIKQLYQVSSRMKEQLLEATEVQGAMLESQKQSLKIQNDLLDHGKELGIVLKSSSESVNNMVKDFRESAKDQKELLYEIFSYLRTFQNWIIGEVSWFQSIMYYTVSCILCALFSSSRKTVDARVTLFTILSLNIVAERILVQYYDNVNHQSNDYKETLLKTTWIYRKIALTLCICTLLCTYYCYKDKEMESYNALQRIEKHLTTIQESSSDSINQPIRCSARLNLKRLQAKANK